MQVREKLVKAVERLESLKAKSTPGPLYGQNAGDVFTELAAPNAQGVNAEHNDAWHVASFMSGQNDMPYREEEANRELYLTLHRTLDAQVAVLNAALNWFDEFYLDAPTYNDGRPMGAERMFLITPWRAAEMLADAILGDVK